jgi:type II secretory pathway pseudopilin PulG
MHRGLHHLLADRRKRGTSIHDLRTRLLGESGQSLVLVVIAMSLIVVLAAFAIDVAQWQVGRHKAQVTADATALAAANCLASLACTQPTPSGDATSKAQAIANDNGYPNSSVSLAYTSSTVQATLTTSVPSTFAGFAGITSTSVTATATASYNTLPGYKSTCVQTGAATCYSLFAGNPNCDSAPSIPSNYVGLDLITNDNGGGSSNLSQMFANGYYWNGGNSGASQFVVTTVGTSSPPCANSLAKSSTTTYKYTPSIVPYPEPFVEPSSCDHTAASWTPATVAGAGAGVYCVSAKPSTSCSDGATASGDIDVNMSSLPGGTYEFVGPCVTVAGQSATATNIDGQPLVYGTSNIATVSSKLAFGTATALPTCTLNNGTNKTSTYLDGSPTAGPAIYDQCGTVEVTGNGGYTGFVEAWNISLDKNNAVTGNGPTSVTGAGMTTLPGGDSLVG